MEPAERWSAAKILVCCAPSRLMLLGTDCDMQKSAYLLGGLDTIQNQAGFAGLREGQHQILQKADQHTEMLHNLSSKMDASFRLITNLSQIRVPKVMHNSHTFFLTSN